MSTKFFSFILMLLFLSVVLNACKTYLIPVQSFKEQFNGIDSTKLRLVKTRGPAGDVAEYLANPIEYIKCVDKSDMPLELKNSPSIEIRFTEKNNKRTIFYFDRLFVQDTLIIGEMSRFIRFRKGISINNVILIEVQDGHKNFKYVEDR
ncbi:MAG: hypothetical protein KA807_11265 [Prolixibacteraceae bacterium]|nr:hypothetical protein [Prolixibacteraceae bacterium]